VENDLDRIMSSLAAKEEALETHMACLRAEQPEMEKDRMN
jgi:hypothetical protein